MTSSLFYSRRVAIVVFPVVVSFTGKGLGTAQPHTQIALYNAKAIGTLIGAALFGSLASISQNPLGRVFVVADIAKGRDIGAGHVLWAGVIGQITALGTESIVWIDRKCSAKFGDTLAGSSADFSQLLGLAIWVGQGAILSTGAVGTTGLAVWIIVAPNGAANTV